MLTRLHIENIAVIEKAEIAFDTGLNVLTGETGAGKSMVIDAINAVLGERVSRDVVRSGSDKADVTALFSDLSRQPAPPWRNKAMNRMTRAPSYPPYDQRGGEKQLPDQWSARHGFRAAGNRPRLSQYTRSA